jgi:hypothetical protein
VGHDRRQASGQGGQAVQRAVSTPLPPATASCHDSPTISLRSPCAAPSTPAWRARADGTTR